MRNRHKQYHDEFYLAFQYVRTYLISMSRPSNREKILAEGLRIVHERGFAGASVRDIAQAAQVPLGSFTNHFASKEAFGLEILELYFARSHALVDETLRNDALPPLQRIALYIDRTMAKLHDKDMRSGCLLGNFGAEVTDHCETMRLRLIEIFEEVRQSLIHALHAAVAGGDLPADFDCEDAAGFMFSALQGAILVSKTLRSDIPMQRYKRQVFGKILR
jgi:TetR/AcrR family transcriptional regulator, transcriptional repressor for nem operon